MPPMFTRRKPSSSTPLLQGWYRAAAHPQTKSPPAAHRSARCCTVSHFIVSAAEARVGFYFCALIPALRLACVFLMQCVSDRGQSGTRGSIVAPGF